MKAWERKLANSGIDVKAVTKELRAFEIETPSWGYANTGTRFGKFLQAAAATTLSQKIEDAAEVHRLTGIAPRMAVHVLWDFPDGFDPAVVKLAKRHRLAIGAINPNLFQDQCYKYGSLANPDARVRRRAVRHCLDSIEIGRRTKSSALSLWFADGTNYPGQDDLVRRKRCMEECLAEVYAAMPRSMTMLIEYKPFEPATYATDIPDWGTAAMLARKCGPRARVLVDTGHHAPGVNVEQIVALLLDEGMLGGFHFNDRKYADDDLTAGSIAPYQLFLIFDQIVAAKKRGTVPDNGTVPLYMIDQSHNEKPKVEAMVQTVVNIEELYAKALIVDRAALRKAQRACDVVGAEETLRAAFFTGVRELLGAVREEMRVPRDPLAALRASGYEAKRATERRSDRGEGSNYA